MGKKAQIYILSGPPGAGKSTIGELLAKKVPNSAIVSTDSIRHLIKNGKAEKLGSNWEEQLKLGAENACILANNFVKNGFNVFLDDVVCEKTRMDTYIENLVDPVFIALFPSRETVAKRDLERGDLAMKERAMYLYDEIQDFLEKEKRFIVIDSTHETAEETMEKIIKELKIDLENEN
jgi:guanylate kinase